MGRGWLRLRPDYDFTAISIAISSYFASIRMMNNKQVLEVVLASQFLMYSSVSLDDIKLWQLTLRPSNARIDHFYFLASLLKITLSPLYFSNVSASDWANSFPSFL